MSQSFNYERAATVLADAIFMGDKAAAEKWDVSTRSIEAWRSRLSEDRKLAGLFNVKKQAREKTWAAEIPGVISAALSFIKTACHQADPGDPNVLKSIVEAVKVLTEVDLTKQVLDARLAAQSEDA